VEAAYPPKGGCRGAVVQNPSGSSVSPSGSVQRLQYRDVPERIVLGPRPGFAPSEAPPVRIFLGTEDAQYRAERVFVYSVEKHRDPSRTYEIHLMKNVRGFDRKGWRTNFTNYRFAIPDWAGRVGKAIYNDVDEIYLVDPALLFDLDLAGHGYAAVSAQDTSVMLIDCERMAPWWNLQRASTRDKSDLLTDAASQPGLWQALDPGWNARDLEYDPATSKCVHFTLLHTQPWMPCPDQYSYHPHPFGDLWFSLEREADSAGFRAFTRERPSSRFEAALDAAAHLLVARGPLPRTHDGDVAGFVARHAAKSVLSCSLTAECAEAAASGCGGTVTLHVPRAQSSWPSTSLEAGIVVDLLEHLPSEDVGWTLDEIFRCVRGVVSFRVAVGESEAIQPPTESDPVFCLRPASWWREQITTSARGRAAWRLETYLPADPEKPMPVLEAKSLKECGDPRVWVLLGVKSGDNAQALDLAGALGWAYEVKRLRFNPLHVVPSVVVGGSLTNLDRAESAPLDPPWPDIIISAGKRSVPVARWIRDQSGGRAKLVHIGRPWAPLDWFDLIITTPQYGLPARANVLHNTLPLQTVDRDGADSSRELDKWKHAIAALPRPLTALLVGGDSPSYTFDATTAARLGAEASTTARARGGSLLVVTSSRTGDASADALEAAIDCPHYFHRFRPGAAENPYRAFLTLSDTFIVTGDSASMLAEACATGKPVSIYAIPRRFENIPGSRLLRDGVWNWRASRTTYRGTPKQQDWMARMYDRLVENGLVTPPRDLAAYHERLSAEGLATIGLGSTAQPPRPRKRIDDLARAVERVRQVWTGARPVA
jgi:mitochondrial fission protein ELM1